MDRKVGERERRCDRKGLNLGVTKSKIDDELDWAVRCEGCGEGYVLREVGAEETTFTVAQHTIPSHKTHAVE